MPSLARLRGLIRETAGQDLLEYALLAALIALVVYSAVDLTGTRIDELFDVIADTMGTAAGAGGA